MTTILMVGADAPLLEGISQTLAASGYHAMIAHGIGDAIGLASREPPLIALVDRDLAMAGSDVLRLPLAPGGMLVLYHTSGSRDVLPAAIQRATLADLVLPLERMRLVALTQSIFARAQSAGRGRHTPPESHPIKDV